MDSPDKKNQDGDWVDRWSRKLVVVAQQVWTPTRDFANNLRNQIDRFARRAWPPTHEWLKQRYEELALGVKVVWPPTRDWVRHWSQRSVNALDDLQRSFRRWLERLQKDRKAKLAEAAISTGAPPGSTSTSESATAAATSKDRSLPAGMHAKRTLVSTRRLRLRCRRRHCCG